MNQVTSGIDPGSRPSVAASSIYLLPGDLGASATPTRYSTVLGSCVAVCLFDATAGVGGMNHYLLPGRGDPGDGNTLRWSDSSLETLLQRTITLGASPSRIRAKVFGGASISNREVPERLRIGDLNVVAAMTFLNQHRIAIISQDVGGHSGRKVIFDADSGAAWVKLLSPRPP